MKYGLRSDIDTLGDGEIIATDKYKGLPFCKLPLVSQKDQFFRTINLTEIFAYKNSKILMEKLLKL